MARGYTMRGVQSTADRAVALACRHLLSEDPGSQLHDVQQDPRFQHRGIDLLWERSSKEVLGVEVKGDRHVRRGNYFFELVSNLERDTPGCFLYSGADWLLYVFLGSDEVHALPLPATRAWFLERAKQYPVKHTRTMMGEQHYTTLGALVPVAEVQREVPGARRCQVAIPPLERAAT